MNREINVNHVCHDNAYGYFCAYSALCLRRGYTWGVAPGYKLLRLQRVLRAGHSPAIPKWLRLFPR